MIEEIPEQELRELGRGQPARGERLRERLRERVLAGIRDEGE